MIIVPIPVQFTSSYGVASESVCLTLWLAIADPYIIYINGISVLSNCVL